MSTKKLSRILVGLIVGGGYIYAMWMMWHRHPAIPQLGVSSQTILTGPLLIQPESIQLLYDAHGRTLTQRGEDYSCDAVINAGYFGYDEHGQYIPAGVRHLGDDVRPHSDPSDPDLAHLVHLGNGTSRAVIQPNTITINPGDIDPNSAVFSAGPLLIDEGKVWTGITQNISHRQGNYPRTVLLSDSYTFGVSFVLFPEPITLSELTQELMTQPIVSGHTVAINLDGGPSTAYRSRSHPEQSFRATTRLPLVFCLME